MCMDYNVLKYTEAGWNYVSACTAQPASLSVAPAPSSPSSQSSSGQFGPLPPLPSSPAHSAALPETPSYTSLHPLPHKLAGFSPGRRKRSRKPSTQNLQRRLLAQHRDISMQASPLELTPLSVQPHCSRVCPALACARLPVRLSGRPAAYSLRSPAAPPPCFGSASPACSHRTLCQHRPPSSQQPRQDLPASL